MNDSAGGAHTDPRVVLALERTLLAWTRTALALIAFGFVVGRVGVLMADRPGAPAEPTLPGLTWIGAALVLLGGAVQAVGLVAHATAIGRLRRGDALPLRLASPATLLAAFLTAASVALALYLTVAG